MTNNHASSQLKLIVVGIIAALISLLLFAPVAHADLDSIRNVTADSVTSNGATINAEIYNLGGYGDSHADVIYGTTPTPDLTWNTTATTQIPHNNQWVTYSQAITGTPANTTVYYEVESYQLQQSGQYEASSSPVQSFTTASAAPIVVLGTSTVDKAAQTTLTLSGQVNSNGAPTTYHWQLGPKGGPFPTWTISSAELNLPSGAGNQTAQSVVHGLDPDTAYNAVLVATNADGSTWGEIISVQTTPITAPTVEAVSASSNQGDRGTARISFDANGAATSCSAQIVSDADYHGTTVAFDDDVPSVPCDPASQNGDEPLTASASFTELTNLTTYHVRFTLTNSEGSVFVDTAFKTNAPEISNVEVSDVTDNAATISFDLNDHGLPAAFGFALGHGSSGASSTTPNKYPASDQVQHISFRDTGLQADTAYSYGLSVSTDGGSTTANGSFRTLPAAPSGSGAGPVSNPTIQPNPQRPLSIRVSVAKHGKLAVTGSGFTPGKVSLYQAGAHGKKARLLKTVSVGKNGKLKTSLKWGNNKLRLLVKSRNQQIGPLGFQPKTMKAKSMTKTPGGGSSTNVTAKGGHKQRHKHQSSKSNKQRH